ncbi:G-protein coupled receptor GRL101-like [Physella acuta]|uniref:G-protein coupled receptor GRL101-like n=1 Tax=Physella acuta TaxID=109671 RepID=UPI0027DDB77E|nr:G-protein coupled receptor GRL101-like [Physella acuta]
MRLQMSKLTFLEKLDLSFTPLSSLKFVNNRRFSMLYLNISFTFLNTVHWYDKDISIDVIDLRNTKLNYDLKTSKLLQKVSAGAAVYGDSYKLCCDKFKGPGIRTHSCKAPKDAISSCENLLGHVVKHILIWMVAMVGLTGNAVVIGYRLFYEKHLLKQGYRMFVTHLGLSDFIMSVYLMIIAGADVYYRDDYVLYEDSSLCKAAGFLATLSAETSTLFVLMITIDRYLIFKDSLNQTKMTPKILTAVVSLIWAIGTVISTIPVVFPDWQIYSSNAMCLGLPVNVTHPLGWMFSLLLYIGINFIIIVLIVLGQIVIFKHITMPRSSLVSSSVLKRREITVANNLSFVVISKILCWFPIGVIGLMSASGHVFSPDVYGWLAVVVLPLNSAVNPILYILPAAYKAFNNLGKTRPEMS